MEQDRLKIEPPAELLFRGPFTQVVSSELVITNPTDKKICYKVKTTAPKKYCAQPNGGILQPHQSETVSIMLQPFDVTKTENAVHKLMIQYLFMPSEDMKYEDAWRNAKKSDLKDSILQCLLEDEDGQQANGVSTDVASPTTPTSIMTEINGDTNGHSGNTKVENEEAKTSSLKRMNKDLDMSHFRTSICAINQTIKSESSMEVLTQLQNTMAELHQKIASLIERFNEESVEEIISLKVRLEQLEDKMADKNTTEPVTVSKIPQLQKTKGKQIIGKDSKSTQNMTALIEKLQRKEDESARKIALLTEKIEIQKSQQEAQQQAFRNTTAQQMTDLLQRIDHITQQTAMTQRLFNAVKPHWLIPQSDVRLSQYELGSGGWGKVVKATYKGEKVAAKCLHHQIVSDHNIQQLVHEIDIFSKCHHPSLLKFLGATLDGDPIILTELMHTNLQMVIKQKKLADYQIIPLLQDVASAINYLHSYKPDPIIHRDISSTNVLLEGPVKSRWVAKLSDFWSSNFLWNTSEQSVSPGNPTYAAPEVRNPRSHTEKMDIYSFGVLVFEICSSQSPSLQVRNEVLPTAATMWPKPQCDFVPLIISCTREIKEDRPTMTEVLAFL